MFAIQNIKTGKFLTGTDYSYYPPHQRTHTKIKCLHTVTYIQQSLILIIALVAKIIVLYA